MDVPEVGEGPLGQSIFAVEVNDHGASTERGCHLDHGFEGPLQIESREVPCAQDGFQLRLELRPQRGKPGRRIVHRLVAGHGELLSDKPDQLRFQHTEAEPADGVVDVVEVADDRLPA